MYTTIPATQANAAWMRIPVQNVDGILEFRTTNGTRVLLHGGSGPVYDDDDNHMVTQTNHSAAAAGAA